MDTKEQNYTVVSMVNLKLVKEESFSYSRMVTGEDDVVEIMKPYLADSWREEAYCIGMNNRNHTTIIHRIGIGGISSCAVPIASVVKPLLLANCSTCILVHSHPSNYMVSSESDRAISRKVKEALSLFEIELLDHVIVDSSCTRSLSMRSEFIVPAIW